MDGTLFWTCALAAAMLVGMGKGGMPDMSKMSPAELEAAAKGMKEGMGMGGGFPGLPRGMSLPSSLSGLMKKK